jgi:hypothetical protein
MCDSRPGVRCSDYATSTLKITKKRLAKIQEEKAAYEEKYAESLANTENPSPRDVIRQNKHKRLIESEQDHLRIVDGAEFEYYSCPVGQAELEADLAKAIEDGDVPLKEELEARIEAGKEYRATNRQNLRDLQEIEKEQGLEAAQEAGWQKYEEAVEAETEATIQLEKSQAELDAARAEAEEYERAMEEYRKNDRVDTPEEELEKARKRKMQLVLIGSLAAAVLVYSLVRQSSTGQKSQLLQSGKSMMMRQVMTGGRQYITKLMSSGAREEDARELRAEREAERRAAIAREKVLRKHEQTSTEEERKQQRNEERMADLNYRNALREHERAAERERRAEELAHYDELVKKFKDVPLTPEMQAIIDSKKPARPSRSGSGNRGTSGDGRAYSTRRQNQPNVAGAAAQTTGAAAGSGVKTEANSNNVTQEPVPATTQAMPQTAPANA